ncbi:hypothetical protein Ciccas_010479, partial [Cichlidogyrus casuarinus]
ILRLASKSNFPLYGSLLNRICDTFDRNNNNSVSWPDFYNFLEKLHSLLVETKPELGKKFSSAPLVSEASKKQSSRQRAINNFRRIVREASLNFDC